MTYLGLKTQNHTPAITCWYSQLVWYHQKRQKIGVFNTSTVCISEVESGKEGRFQIKLWEHGLMRPTAFSFKQKKPVRAKVFTSLKRSPLSLNYSRLRLLINIALSNPQPGSNCCKLSSQEHAITVNQAYRKSFSIFSICFTFNLLTPQDFFKIPRI